MHLDRASQYITESHITQINCIVQAFTLQEFSRWALHLLEFFVMQAL